MRGSIWFAWIGKAGVFLLGAALAAQAQLNLTGIARDFQELLPKTTTGGHPDFNQTWNPGGWEGWGCFDRPSAAKGAVQTALSSADANPDRLAGLIPYDRDEAGPALKPGYDTPPNCFRSRFNEWYTTRSPDINRAFFLDVNFTKDGNVYKYDNQEFFPLDDDKVPSLKPQVPSVTTTFGHRQTGISEGVDLGKHNFGFTFEFHSRFTYKQGSGQQFAFRGDDDVWVFINDKLVIDLGGLHAAEFAEVNLDTLGLADGKPYYLDFFFAERRVEASRLTITTSLELKNTDKPLDPPAVVGPEISRAWKVVADTNLNEIPGVQLVVLFSGPVKVDAPSVLKFLDPSGNEVRVDMSAVRADSAVNGFSRQWTFTIAPGSPDVPGDGYKVAIAGVSQVKDAQGKPADPANPWRPVETRLPDIVIGELVAEKGVTSGTPVKPAQVKDPFVLLTSKDAQGEAKTYVPLHPESAGDWIRGNTGAEGNPGVAVFGFKLSHPATLKLAVFDNLGQFVNRTELTVTREDLLSGKLARDPETRAFLLRFAWFPVSHDGNLISTGVYIMRAEFSYGQDPRDNVERGKRLKVAKFGFLRGNEIRGLGLR
ncbi:MAG: fibro-slime family protein [Fibrobacteres bacterium]|nr:fibro-slime family protein [Fibrobacterota bacterium]